MILLGASSLGENSTFLSHKFSKINLPKERKMLELKNGVKVYLEKNSSSPVVAIQIWAQAGSGSEKDEQAGIAHLIEHMSFRGSEHYPSGEVARRIEELGGALNAFTSIDFTVYHTVISRRFFSAGLEALSALVLHPLFLPEELEREREVVLEEIRREEDNPRVRLYHQLFSLAYQTHPYRRPVIGYQEQVAGFTSKDLKEFWSCYYQPKNLRVVIVGDIELGGAQRLVKKIFKKVEPGSSCPEQKPEEISEPEQKKLRLKLSPEKLEQSYVYLGWKIPGFGHPDMPALDLLAVILGQGESSRLVEQVRDKTKLVNQVWAYAYTPRGPGLFIIGTSLEPARLIDGVGEIIAQLQALKTFGIEDWELERAKRQIESDAIYSRETMEGRARRLGFFISLTEDPDYEEKYLKAIEQTSKEDIIRCAKKYLKSSNLSLAGIVPENRFKPSLEQELEKAIFQAERKKPAPLEKQKPPYISAPLYPFPRVDKAKMVSEPKRFVLKNGVRLLVRENHYVPLVSVRAGFLGGVRFEDEATNGVFNLIAEMLTEGTEQMSGQEIHRQIESLAGSLAGFSGRNSFGLTMTVPSANFERALEIFAQVLTEPSFPEQELERIRYLVLGAIRREKDQPRILVNRLFLKTLYQHHPYRFNPLGNEESLARLKRGDLQEFYQRFAGPENLVIAVSGDIDPNYLKVKLEELFTSWKIKKEKITPPSPEPELAKSRITQVKQKTAQAHIMLGWLGTTLSSPDQPAVEVLSEILSGMSGRLFIHLRDEQSLAYELSAYHLDGLEPGFIAGYIGCAPEKAEQAVRGLKQEFDRLKKELVAKEELERAKNSLIGNYEIELQSNLTVATHIFFDELYGLGFGHWQRYSERIQSVSAKQIQEVARRYIKPVYALAVISPKPISLR